MREGGDGAGRVDEDHAARRAREGTERARHDAVHPVGHAMPGREGRDAAMRVRVAALERMDLDGEVAVGGRVGREGGDGLLDQPVIVPAPPRVAQLGIVGDLQRDHVEALGMGLDEPLRIRARATRPAPEVAGPSRRLVQGGPLLVEQAALAAAAQKVAHREIDAAPRHPPAEAARLHGLGPLEDGVVPLAADPLDRLLSRKASGERGAPVIALALDGDMAGQRVAVLEGDHPRAGLPSDAPGDGVGRTLVAEHDDHLEAVRLDQIAQPRPELVPCAAIVDARRRVAARAGGEQPVAGAEAHARGLDAARGELLGKAGEEGARRALQEENPGRTDALRRIPRRPIAGHGLQPTDARAPAPSVRRAGLRSVAVRYVMTRSITARSILARNARASGERAVGLMGEGHGHS